MDVLRLNDTNDQIRTWFDSEVLNLKMALKMAVS